MALTARMPELSALEVLLAVARHGSLNAAGREIGVSQQAISARIASLEALTGVPLVTRTAQGSTLTPNGVVAAQWADRLLQVAAEVDAGLAALRHDKQQRLKVSASLTIAEQLLPGWIVSLQMAAKRANTIAPNIVLTAANSDAVIDHIRSGHADLGFIEGPAAPRGIRSRVVAHDQLIVVARADHPWVRRNRLVTAADLLTTPLVSREPGSGTRDALAAALLATLGPDAEQAAPVFELSTAASVREAVLAGAGPAVLSELAVSDDLASHRLHRVDIDGLDLRRDLRAIWLGGRTPPPGAARDLLGHIASRARTRAPLARSVRSRI